MLRAKECARLLALPLFSLQTHIWIYLGAWERVNLDLTMYTTKHCCAFVITLSIIWPHTFVHIYFFVHCITWHAYYIAHVYTMMVKNTIESAMAKSDKSYIGKSIHLVKNIISSFWNHPWIFWLQIANWYNNWTIIFEFLNMECR